MKAFLFILGLVAAGILGYSFEPQFRLSLTGKTPGEKPASPDPVEETPAEIPVAIPAIDPATIPADRLPAKVLLKAEAEIVDAASDLRMKVPAGNRMNLIRLEGGNVIISPGAGPFEGSVPIEQTDLMEQLAAMPDTPPAADPPAVAAVDTPSEEPDTAPPVEPEMPADPPSDPVPAPVEEDPAAPAPEPAPAGSGDPVAIMKASIQAGDIKEFSFDQVLEWEAGEGPETIDGESYLTGIASYKAETVFGVKTIQAKALIQDGKVVRWLWPKSGMEIK